jgi:hypothetical protein
LIQEALIVATILEGVAIGYLYLRQREPYVVKPTKEKIEDLDLVGIGKAIGKFKPLIIRHLVKKADKEKEEPFKARKETISQLIDGVSDLLSSGGIGDIYKIVRKAM